jgi:hypothetical protein
MKYVESVERYVEQQYHDFTQAYQKGEYL